ncbi:hypothetical protein OAF82_00075 [bacterium]|nr:hypothetical protein [bacterium]
MIVALGESDTLRFREIGQGLSALAAQLPREFKATVVSSDHLVNVRYREPESSDCVLGVLRDAQIPDELRELIEVAEVESLIKGTRERNLLVTRRSKFETKHNLNYLPGADVLVSPGKVQVSGGGITAGGLERFSKFLESLNGQKCTFCDFGRRWGKGDGESILSQALEKRVIIPQELRARWEEKDQLQLIVMPAHVSKFSAAYAKAGSERQRAFLQELFGLALSCAKLVAVDESMDPYWPWCDVSIDGSTGADERGRRERIVAAQAQAEIQRRLDRAEEKRSDREIRKSFKKRRW